MLRKSLLAAAFAAGAAFTLPAPVLAQGTTTTTPTAMPTGSRMTLNAQLGQRVVRQVMIGDNGSTIDVIYDMGAGQPQSQRVLRLENVNGMLQVIYDTSVPAMNTGSGGTPRLVQQGGGMYEVVYGPR